MEATKTNVLELTILSELQNHVVNVNLFKH